MGKKKTIIISLVFVLAALAIFAAVNQRNNIKALITYGTASPEDISGQIAASKEIVNNALAEYDLPYRRDFTAEEELMLMKGEITYDEAMKVISKENAADEGTNDTKMKNEDNKQENAMTESSETEELIGELYSIKAYYLGELGAVMKGMKDEYNSLPPEEKTTSAKVSILQDNMSRAGLLEKECDAKVYDIVEKIRKNDSSLADTISSAYEEEKALKKAYYLSNYK